MLTVGKRSFQNTVLALRPQEMKLVVMVLCSLVALAAAAERFQFVEEWTLWKTEHRRYYTSEREELERHSVWLANREYILTHNSHQTADGYTLALNQFADLVGSKERGLVSHSYDYVWERCLTYKAVAWHCNVLRSTVREASVSAWISVKIY